MSKLKLMALLLAVAGLSFGIAACGGDDDEGDGGGDGGTQLDLTIGQLVPQTGDLSPFAPAGEFAADQAIQEIESAISEAGAEHTVTMLTEDTQTQDQAGVSAARRVVGEGASCIAGAWASGTTIPVAESVSIRQGVLQISPASTSPDITELEDEGLINRTAPSDVHQGPLLADIVEQGLGGAEGMTVNVGARNDPYGTDLADTFTEGWEEKGGTVGETVIYDVDLPSYDSEANQLARGNPDAWFFVDFPEPFDQVGAALVRTGNWDPSVSFGPDGLAFPNLPDLVGQDVTEGMRVSAPGAEPSEQADAFNQAFTDAGEDRGPFDAQNFDAVVLCYLAAVAAGSADGTDMAEALPDVTNPGGTEYSYLELADAIQALEDGEDIDYQGVSGPIDLDENGDPTAGVYGVFSFQGNQMEQVDEIEFSADGNGGGNGGE